MEKLRWQQTRKPFHIYCVKQQSLSVFNCKFVLMLCRILLYLIWQNNKVSRFHYVKMISYLTQPLAFVHNRLAASLDNGLRSPTYNRQKRHLISYRLLTIEQMLDKMIFFLYPEKNNTFFKEKSPVFLSLKELKSCQYIIKLNDFILRKILFIHCKKSFAERSTCCKSCLEVYYIKFACYLHH